MAERVFRERRLRDHYEAPPEEGREKAEAIRRARKLARKTLQWGVAADGSLGQSQELLGRDGPSRAPR